MTISTPKDECLDVAIDHRIKRLFKPTNHSLRGSSDHVSYIEARGRALGRPSSEIKVTADLAGPAMKGGIAIALQQPRDNHPFDKGVDGVISDCETLFALYDIFNVVSCDTLDIRGQVSVVDLMPYVSDNVKDMEPSDIRDAFTVSTDVICAKEPDVLICAGSIWLQNSGKTANVKGDAWRFENIGVGQRFGTTPNRPITAKIRTGHRGFVSIPRVNGFHPSHAINYLPHVSLLRQLQILIGAEACGTLRGDWEEEDWMTSLRTDCQTRRAEATAAGQSPSRTSRRTSSMYLSDYEEIHCDRLSRLSELAVPLIRDSSLGSESTETTYTRILSLGLSELCNDLSLILRQMSILSAKPCSEQVRLINEEALTQAKVSMIRFVKEVLSGVILAGDSRISQIFKARAMSIRTDALKGAGALRNFTLNLDRAGEIFLKLAVDIESHLGALLDQKERALSRLGQEEVLSGLMGRMSIAALGTESTPRYTPEDHPTGPSNSPPMSTPRYGRERRSPGPDNWPPMYTPRHDFEPRSTSPDDWVPRRRRKNRFLSIFS